MVSKRIKIAREYPDGSGEREIEETLNGLRSHLDREA